jgi:hypothetical protein
LHDRYGCPVISKCNRLLVDRSDPEATSKPLVQSSISDINQKSELKPPEVMFESSKVVAPDEKKQIGINSGSNNNSGAPRPHQVEREGNCYW